MIASAYRVRTGSLNCGSGGQLSYAERIVMHPQYSPRNADNDIGLILLTDSL